MDQKAAARADRVARCVAARGESAKAATSVDLKFEIYRCP